MDDLNLLGDDELDEYPEAFRWDTLDDNERLQRSQQLAQWVDWLINRYRLHRTIRPCWWQHSAQVEELSALWIAWRGVHETPDRPDGWIWWHDHLTRTINRIEDHWNTGCDTQHTPAVDSPHPTSADFKQVR